MDGENMAVEAVVVEGDVIGTLAVAGGVNVEYRSGSFE
jgi:hypothetical protein